MNNFDGQLKLYPEICVDNFASDIIFNVKIRAYILTHFHDDHMKNLEDYQFYRLLKENVDRVKFYCSPITKKFIETCEKYSHLSEFCTEIPCESPFIIHISNAETVTATFCGSGHCPGSVMVFMEGLRGNVLFTGDFRLPLYCASRLPFFKENSLASRDLFSIPTASQKATKNNSKHEYNAKNVDDLYVDMTFFKPEIKTIPTREESVQVLVKFIKEFISQNNEKKMGYFQNLVYMKTSARIGYEYVYQTIYSSTGYKVHVNNLIYKIYDKMPMIQSSLTVDPYETPIHCCIYENKKRDVSKTDLMSSPFGNKKQQTCNVRNDFCINSNSVSSEARKRPAIPCMLVQNEANLNHSLRTKSIKIILSAMWFTDTAGVDNILVEYKPPKSELNTPAYKYYSSIYRLCYSFHSSLEEIVDFVDTLRPKKLFSIALPESTGEKQINQYFFDSNNRFIGFHQVNTNDKKREIDEKRNETAIKKPPSDKLVLRKRKSFELLGNHDSDSSDFSEKSNDGLVFGSESDDDAERKKIKF